jgi:hypothetical protein
LGKKIIAPTKFAVVVRLEDLGSEVEIYSKVVNEIENIIEQQVETRVKT